MVNRMSPEERTELERELNDDSTREFLARTQAEHEARQTKIAEERERRAPEVQAAHAAFIASLLEDKPRKRDVKRKKT